MKRLENNDISYEYYQLANCQMILVFTGGSGYDIVGVSAKMQNRRIELEDIIH